MPRLTREGGGSSKRAAVLLVDRHPLFLAALSEVLCAAFPDFHIEAFTRSDRALELASTRQVDLVFCELQAEPIRGADLVAQLNQVTPKTRTILLGDAEDGAVLVTALSGGADGFFTKDASPEEFLEGVEAVVAGHHAVGRNLLQLSLERLTEPAARPQAGTLAQLSPAEIGILARLAQGNSVHAIAATRTISEKTVRNHLANIYRKLGLRNRSEATLWSARVGLIDAGPNNP